MYGKKFGTKKRYTNTASSALATLRLADFQHAMACVKRDAEEAHRESRRLKLEEFKARKAKR